jgi:hypothetical protein
MHFHMHLLYGLVPLINEMVYYLPTKTTSQIVSYFVKKNKPP